MTSTESAPPQKSKLRLKIVEEYETLLRLHEAQEPFLEIGHGPRQSAISLAKFLAGRERHVVVRGEGGEIGGAAFHKGNANDMTKLFDNECFGTVIWDRAIESDAFFWLTLAEIKRVLMPGGIFMVSANGFSKNSKFGIKVTGAKGNVMPFLTATGSASEIKADFWRISPQAMRKVIFNGFDVKEVRVPLMVPYVFGVAAKPA